MIHNGRSRHHVLRRLLFCLLVLLLFCVNNLSLFPLETAEVNATSITENNNPIIIVPGVMGSRLYDNNDNLVWIQNTSNKGKLLKDTIGIGTKIKYHRDNGKMAVKNNVINQSTLPKSSREYGTDDVYKKIVDDLIEHFPSREVYFFSYDWRISILDSADDLSEMINIISQNGKLKVDIVAHSMGGLLTSAYMKKFADSSAKNVEKVITCGTPYEGSPLMLENVTSDRTTNDDFSNFWLRVAGVVDLTVKRSFPSILCLVPSEAYIEKYPFLPKYEENNDWSQLLLMPSTYDSFISSILLKGNSAKIPYDFSTYQYINSDLDDQPLIYHGYRYNYLASLSNTYFVVGTGKKTMQRCAIYRSTNVSGRYRAKHSNAIFNEDGDNTVPLASATMMGTLERLFNNTDRYLKTTASHDETINSVRARSYIKSILSKPSTQTPPQNSAEQPTTINPSFTEIYETYFLGRGLNDEDPDSIERIGSQGGVHFPVIYTDRYNIDRVESEAPITLLFYELHFQGVFPKTVGYNDILFAGPDYTNSSRPLNDWHRQLPDWFFNLDAGAPWANGEEDDRPHGSVYITKIDGFPALIIIADLEEEGLKVTLKRFRNTNRKFDYGFTHPDEILLERPPGPITNDDIARIEEILQSYGGAARLYNAEGSRTDFKKTYGDPVSNGIYIGY